MGLLDRLFRRAPPAPERRRFDAASGGRRAPRSMGPLNPEIAAAADIVARGARYHRHNDPWLSNGVEALRTSLVGTGIRPTAKGLDPAMRQTVAGHFESWASRADPSGVCDFWGLQSLVAEHLVVDGEALVLLHPEPDGLRLQVVAPEQLDRSKSAELSDGRIIAQGVEIDAQGRRLAYWILPTRPDGEFANFAPAQRIEAEYCLHVFRPMAAGQVRGISWLAPAIITANELDQLTDALLVSAKTAAMLSAFVTDLNQMGGGSAFGEPDANGEISLEPGTIRRLGPGESVEFLTPQQLRDAPAFLTMNLRALAAALSIPEFMLSGDLSQANYSSLRGGLIPFRQRVEALQYGVLAPQFLNRVWRAWLAVEVLAGRLDAPADTAAEWIPPRQPWVDPAKDLAAVREALSLGLMSRSQAVAEMGWSIDALDAEIAADRQREKDLGLTFGGEE